ncbi:RAD50 (predicted), partial [Pycnogonum litorale]
NIKKLQNKKANLSASTVVFNKFIDKLKKENACCPLCHREFDDENDIPELIIELQGKLKDVPNLIANVESGLCSEEKNYKNMLQLKPIKDDIDKKMSTEIPKLKKQAQFLEDEICKLRATVIKEENVLQSHDKDEASANEIRSDMGSLDQCQSELTKISKTVEFLESKIVGYDSTRTLQQVNQDRNDVESYLSREKGEIDRKKERISNYQNQLCDARIKVTDLKTEKQQVSEDLQQKNILEENKAKLRASSNELDAAIKDAGLKIKPIEWELNEKKQTKDMKT